MVGARSNRAAKDSIVNVQNGESDYKSSSYGPEVERELQFTVEELADNDC